MGTICAVHRNCQVLKHGVLTKIVENSQNYEQITRTFYLKFLIVNAVNTTDTVLQAVDFA